MTAFRFYYIYERPYFTKLANYSTVHCACLIFVVDCFYKGIF